MSQFDHESNDQSPAANELVRVMKGLIADTAITPPHYQVVSKRLRERT